MLYSCRMRDNPDDFRFPLMFLKIKNTSKILEFPVIRLKMFNLLSETAFESFSRCQMKHLKSYRFQVFFLFAACLGPEKFGK